MSKLNDPYVKFFRWATDRLGDRDGVVCFVTNNSFVEQVAFDGIRKHLLRDFTAVHHVDLQGNTRHFPTLSGSQYNVFGIQVGVGITIAVRHRKHKSTELRYLAVDPYLPRRDKLKSLQTYSLSDPPAWQSLTPDQKGNWLGTGNSALFSTFPALASKTARSSKSTASDVIFKDYSLGIATHRDSVVYDFQADFVRDRVTQFIEDYNTEVDRWKRAPQGAVVDDFVKYERIAWDRDLKNDLRRGRYAEFAEEKLRVALYRPYCHQSVFFDRIVNAEVYGIPQFFPTTSAKISNLAICATGLGAERPFATLITNVIPDLNFFGPGTVPQWFPFYVYDEDGTNRRENITDWALKQFQDHYKDKKIDKWAVFHYVYGLLHHPGYREKFADNLKRELPRIPFAPDFRAFAEAGAKLAKLHLDSRSSSRGTWSFRRRRGSR